MNQAMVSLTIQMPSWKYEALLGIALKRNQDIMSFLKDPVLECWNCPCGNKEQNSCPAGGEGSCLEEFYKFLFFEEPEPATARQPHGAA